MSPEELFLSHLELIERLVRIACRRYHFPREDAEDFASTVKLKLIDDDYGVFRKFEGKSSLNTYLTVVVQRHLLDHLNSRWGKWRPSAVAKRLGPVAEALEELVVRDGRPLREAFEILRKNRKIDKSDRELEEIAARLPRRTGRRFEGEETLENLVAADGSPEQRVRDDERRRLRCRIDKALAEAIQELELEDRLIAEQVARQKSYVEIARRLGIAQKHIYRRVERVLARLRKALIRKGIRPEDVKDLLGGGPGAQ